MKVFFTASYNTNPKVRDFYKSVYAIISKLGYAHVNDDVIRFDKEKYESAVGASREEQVKNYMQKIKSVQKADMCVFEVSSHSLGTGYLINKAFENSKPVAVLYYADNTPFFLTGIKDDRLVIKNYNDDNLEKVLKEALDITRERRDKRFNFFISPKLLEYLESASDKDKVTKSRFIRNLIVRHMQRRKENIDEMDM